MIRKIIFISISIICIFSCYRSTDKFKLTNKIEENIIVNDINELHSISIIEQYQIRIIKNYI